MKPTSKRRCARANDVSESDWNAVCAIVLLFGGEERRLHRSSKTIEDAAREHGGHGVRLCGHHFPVYRWERGKRMGSSRTYIVIDQGDYRFSFSGCVRPYNNP